MRPAQMACNAFAVSVPRPARVRLIARLCQALQVVLRWVRASRSSAAAKQSWALCATPSACPIVDCSTLAANRICDYGYCRQVRRQQVEPPVRACVPASHAPADVLILGDVLIELSIFVPQLEQAAVTSGNLSCRPALPKRSGGPELLAGDRPAESRQRIHERASRRTGAVDRHGWRRDRRVGGPMRGHADPGLPRRPGGGERGRATVREVRSRRRGARRLLLLWRSGRQPDTEGRTRSHAAPAPKRLRSQPGSLSLAGSAPDLRRPPRVRGSARARLH